MQSLPNYTALVTLIVLIVYFGIGFSVGMARYKFGIKAPAVAGNPEFERIFRAQMNTLEWLPIFLPSLWLFALTVSDKGAAVLGLIWALGRLLYFRSYAAAAEKRGPGFGIQALATGILWVGSVAAILGRLVATQ